MKNYLILILSVFMAGCTGSNMKQSSVPTVKIDIKKSAQRLENDFELSHYVILETNESNLVGEIRKLQMINSRIYIFDRQSRSINIFTSAGKHINTINKQGRSSSEYIDISDFEVSKEGIIYVLDDGPKGRILKYDNDGEYVEVIDAPNAVALKILNNDLIALNVATRNNDEHYMSYVCINKDGKIEKEAIPFPSQLAGYTFMPGTELSCFYTSGGDIFMSSMLDDTIYHVSVHDGTVEPYLALDFGRPLPTRGDPVGDYMKIAKGQEPTIPFYFYAWDDHFITSYIYQMKRYYVIATLEGEVIGSGEMGVDRYGLPFWPVSYYDSDNTGYLVTAIQPVHIPLFAKLCREKGLDPSILDKLASDMNIADNPVLCFYRPTLHKK